MKTVLETIQGGAEYLEKGGCEKGRLNMELMLASLLGCPRMQLYVDFDRPLEEAVLGPLREMVKRRREGEPLQHVLGDTEFMGRLFKVDARGLVPRPETEELVERILERVKGREGLRALDVGCGSGVIGLTLAVELGERVAGVTLVDISADARELAVENRGLLGLDESVDVIESDLLAGVGGRRFDVVAANLPYVPRGEIAGLDREVQRDPLVALDGGEVGTELMVRFLAGVEAVLEDGGLVAMEIGSGQGEALAAIVREAGWGEVEVELDLSGNERFVFITKPTK